MNEYRFSDIYVGLEESFSKTVTEEMVNQFLAITDDTNPLHNDEEYAKSKGFKSRVVYGMLTSSLLSTLAGVYLPGKYSLIYSVTVGFSRPVFIGDTLFVKGKVISVDDRFNTFVMKVTIVNESRETVLRGTMEIGIKE